MVFEWEKRTSHPFHMIRLVILLTYMYVATLILLRSPYQFHAEPESNARKKTKNNSCVFKKYLIVHLETCFSPSWLPPGLALADVSLQLEGRLVWSRHLELTDCDLSKRWPSSMSPPAAPAASITIEAPQSETAPPMSLSF